MTKLPMFVLPFAMLAGPASATDFAIRLVSSPTIEHAIRTVTGPNGRLDGAVRVAAQFGRITSTFRSTEHNRAVGGVPNSYHLQGRAIDVARRRDVAHWQIAEALRQAGFQLIESLDEGDHSHFAFGHAEPNPWSPPKPHHREVTNWGIVEVRSPARGS